METFIDNLEKIESFNKKPNETYKQGITEDSDLTYDEKKKYRSGAKVPKDRKSQRSSTVGVNGIAPKSGLTDTRYSLFS